MKKFTLTFTFILSLVFLIQMAPLSAEPGKDSQNPAEVSKEPLPKSYFTEMSFEERSSYTPPEPEKRSLDNGVTLFLMEDHELPMVTLRVVVRTGSFYDPDDQRGLAELTGKVLRTGGTENRSPEEINRALENRAANIEASVGEQKTTLMMSCLKRNFGTVYDIFLDILRNPAFREEKISVQKRKIRSRIERRNDNPRQIASRELSFQLFGRDSIYAREVYPWNLNQIKRSDLQEFYRKYYHAGNLMAGVLGDFDLEQMRSRIGKTIGSMESGSKASVEMEDVSMKPERTVAFAQKEDLTKSIIYMGHPLDVSRTNSDYGALALASEILGHGGFSSRLFNRVRREEGLAYGTTGGYRPNYNYPGMVSLYAGTKSKSTVKTIEVILDTLKNMREEGVSAEELEQAKDSILNSFVFQFDEPGKILSRQMRYHFFDIPGDWVQTYQDQIRNATPEDVHRVTKTYFQPKNLVILVLGNSGKIEGDLSQFGPVEEVDISLPEPPNQTKVESGDREKGSELLKKWKQSIPEDLFSGVKGVKLKGSSTQSRGKRSVEGTFEAIMTLDNRMYRKLEMMGQTITIGMSSDSNWMQDPRGKVKPLPSSLQKKINEEQAFNYLTGILHGITSDEFDAALLSRNTSEDAEQVELLLTKGDRKARVTVNPSSWKIQKLVVRSASGKKIRKYKKYTEKKGIPVPVELVEENPDGTSSRTKINHIEFLQSVQDRTFQKPSGGK